MLFQGYALHTCWAVLVSYANVIIIPALDFKLYECSIYTIHHRQWQWWLVYHGDRSPISSANLFSSLLLAYSYPSLSPITLRSLSCLGHTKDDHCILYWLPSGPTRLRDYIHSVCIHWVLSPYVKSPDHCTSNTSCTKLIPIHFSFHLYCTSASRRMRNLQTVNIDDTRSFKQVSMVMVLLVVPAYSLENFPMVVLLIVFVQITNTISTLAIIVIIIVAHCSDFPAKIDCISGPAAIEYQEVIHVTVLTCVGMKIEPYLLTSN